jgi:radical SAM protein with 4Fe4S-binding SPASM domain
LRARLPLVDEISHRELLGKHLWIGVREAAVLVLDEAESDIVSALHKGIPPLTVSQLNEDRCPAVNGWLTVSTVIGKLAKAGFVKGFTGYVERRPASPDKFSRFHLTQACQLECIHCYADSSPHVDRAGELPTARWQNLAASYIKNGGESILFTGGEALMHPGCLEIMSTVRSEGGKVTLFTNGMLVPKYAQQIHNIANLVQVSLDGPDATSNDKIRGTNTYKQIIKAIDILVEQGTPTKIGMSVMLQNWESWKENFLTFASKYHGTSVEFRLSFGLTHYGRAESLPPIAVEDVQPLASKFMERVNGSTGPKITRVTTGCGYCEQFVVGPNGIVYPCHLLDAPICSIDDHPLPYIIGLLKRATVKFDVDHIDGCNRCDIRYLCGGTCRVIDRQRTGSRLQTSCNTQEKDRKLRNIVRTFS